MTLCDLGQSTAGPPPGLLWVTPRGSKVQGGSGRVLVPPALPALADIRAKAAQNGARLSSGCRQCPWDWYQGWALLHGVGGPGVLPVLKPGASIRGATGSSRRRACSQPHSWYRLRGGGSDGISQLPGSSGCICSCLSSLHPTLLAAPALTAALGLGAGSRQGQPLLEDGQDGESAWSPLGNGGEPVGPTPFHREASWTGPGLRDAAKLLLLRKGGTAKSSPRTP